MKIYLWKGYHQQELITLLEQAWKTELCLIICPPYLDDIDYLLPFLPAGEIVTIGDWKKQQQFANNSQIIYPSTPIIGVFTSGTTRQHPKLVLYSKRNLLTTLEGIFSLFDMEKLKYIYSFPQPFHAFGLVLGYLASIHFNKKIIFEPGVGTPFSIQHWLDLDENIRQGLLTLGTPTHFHDLLFYINAKKITPRPSYSSICGGAKVSCDLWPKLKNELKILLPSIGYGCTEASLAVTHLAPGIEPKEDGELGVPIPGVDAQIVSEGIKIVGPSVCLAMITKNEIDFPQEFIIKDQVKKRSDSVWVYVGRAELFLNRGGEKYLLEDFESTIKKEFNLENVCVAVPDKRLGEELGVAFMKDETTIFDDNFLSRLKTFLKDRYIKGFNSIQISIFDRFPTTDNAKINRDKIVETIVNKVKEKNLTYPISTDLLDFALPHRGAMVWIEKVLSATTESGTCQARVSDFCLDESGKVRESTLLEWMAQAHGFSMAAAALIDGKKNTPSKIFLAAVSDFEIIKNISQLNKKSFVTVHTQTKKQLNALLLVDAQIKNNCDEIIASASLKLYAE